jgi:predicted dehydrogenase
MVDACRRAGVLLMEGFMWRHHPRTTRIVELVRGGEIGELRLVRSSFSFDIDRSDWRLDAARGGGALWDVGCYGVNACRLLCGSEPARVTASARWWPTGVDMTLAATLEFPGGAIGQIDCSFEAPFRCRYEVVGTTGVIEVPDAFLPGETPEIFLHRAAACDRIAAPPGNQYSDMVDHFCSALLGGRPLAPPAEDGLLNMRVLHEIRQSARPATA